MTVFRDLFQSLMTVGTSNLALGMHLFKIKVLIAFIRSLLSRLLLSKNKNKKYLYYCLILPNVYIFLYCFIVFLLFGYYVAQ